mmetsp:Transcript_69238/g.200582  ORF Transcript_69238/g.200582 Transcript_69238/m.200582 type:complete len:368 (-) Transcript_69238:66-1169(-)
MPEELVEIVAQLRREQMVQALHVGQDEEAVAGDHRVICPLPLLVLHNLCTQRLHGLLVLRARRHSAALRGRRKQLRAVFQARGLVQGVRHKLQGLDEHAVGGVLLSPVPVADGQSRHDHQEHKEKRREDQQVVFLLKQEARKADADLRSLRTVGVPVLLVVHLGGLVRKSGVSLRDLDEAGGRQGVVRILVGVVHKRQLAVGLLDLRGRRRGGHLQKGEGVETFDFRLLAELGDGDVHADVDRGNDHELEHPTGVEAALRSGRPRLGVFLDHGRRLAIVVGTSRLALARRILVTALAREDGPPHEGDRPWHDDEEQDAASEIVKSGVVVTEQLFLLRILGEGIPETAGHGRCCVAGLAASRSWHRLP